MFWDFLIFDGNSCVLQIVMMQKQLHINTAELTLNYQPEGNLQVEILYSRALQTAQTEKSQFLVKDVCFLGQFSELARLSLLVQRLQRAQADTVRCLDSQTLAAHWVCKFELVNRQQYFFRVPQRCKREHKPDKQLEDPFLPLCRLTP